MSERSRLLSWESPWLLPLAAALSFFFNLWGVPLFDLDEGAFSAATREMLETGNYVATFLNGEPRHDKPILIYWCQALSVSLFGLNEFALRLPSALAASAWLVALFAFARQVTDQRTAVVGALIMANVLIVPVIGRAATADALLNLWLALALFDIYRYFQSPQRVTAWRVYLWLGLGFLTKGPVAVGLPLLISAGYFFSQRRGRDWWRAVWQPVGWLIFLAVVAPWVVLNVQTVGTSFIEGFIFQHNVGRFTDTMEGHGGNPFYYVVAVPLIVLPFTGLLFAVLAKQGKTLWQDPLNRFLLLWFLVVFVLVSMSQTQLPHYVLYGLSPLFILMARYREQLGSRWLAFSLPVVFFAVLSLLPEALTLWGAETDNAYEREMALWGMMVVDENYRLSAIGMLLFTLVLAFSRRLAPWRALVALGFAQTLWVGAFLLPVVATVQQQPVKEAALVAKQLQLPTVAYGLNMPSFSVYREAITPRRLPEPGELALVRVDSWLQIQTAYPSIPIEVIYHRGGILLVYVPTTAPTTP